MRNLPGQIWCCSRCSCGNCADEELLSVREYRCCKEILEASGKFTWIGENAQCILKHPDFKAMTNETVLREVGPLLRNKNGSCYRIKNGADKSMYILRRFYSTILSGTDSEASVVTAFF